MSPPSNESIRHAAFEVFLESLWGPDREHSSAAVRACAGSELPADVVAYLSAQRTTGSASYGLLHASTEAPCPDAESGRTFHDVLSRPLHLLGALVGALPLGSDGGGQTYFASLDADRPGVALYDPGQGLFSPLTASLESFGALNHAMALWEAFESSQDLDTEALIDGSLQIDLDQPRLSGVRDVLRALHAQVDLDPQREVACDFEETLNALMTQPLRARLNCQTTPNHARAGWVFRALDQGGIRPEDLSSAEPPGALESSADALYALWHAWLSGDDAALNALQDPCSTHSSAYVRDCLRLMRTLLDTPELASELGYVRALRDFACGSLDLDAAPTKEHPLLTSAAETPAIERRQAMLKTDPANADAWNDLAYQHFLGERWESLKSAAKASLSIRPHHAYAWQQLGIAYMGLDLLDEALVAFDHGLCVGDNPNLWLNKAAIHAERGEMKAAQRHVGRIVHPRADELIAAVPELAEFVR